MESRHFTEVQKQLLSTYSEYQQFIKEHPVPRLGYLPLSAESVKFDVFCAKFDRQTREAGFNLKQLESIFDSVEINPRDFDIKNNGQVDSITPFITALNPSEYWAGLSQEQQEVALRFLAGNVDASNKGTEFDRKAYNLVTGVGAAASPVTVGVILTAANTFGNSFFKDRKISVDIINSCADFLKSADPGRVWNISQEHFDDSARRKFSEFREVGKGVDAEEGAKKAGSKKPSSDTSRDYLNRAGLSAKRAASARKMPAAGGAGTGSDSAETYYRRSRPLSPEEERTIKEYSESLEKAISQGKELKFAHEEAVADARKWAVFEVRAKEFGLTCNSLGSSGQHVGQMIQLMGGHARTAQGIMLASNGLMQLGQASLALPAAIQALSGGGLGAIAAIPTISGAVVGIAMLGMALFGNRGKGDDGLDKALQAIMGQIQQLANIVQQGFTQTFKNQAKIYDAVQSVKVFLEADFKPAVMSDLSIIKTTLAHLSRMNDLIAESAYRKELHEKMDEIHHGIHTAYSAEKLLANLETILTKTACLEFLTGYAQLNELCAIAKLKVATEGAIDYSFMRQVLDSRNMVNLLGGLAYYLHANAERLSLKVPFEAARMVNLYLWYGASSAVLEFINQNHPVRPELKHAVITSISESAKESLELVKFVRNNRKIYEYLFDRYHDCAKRIQQHLNEHIDSLLRAGASFPKDKTTVQYVLQTYPDKSTRRDTDAMSWKMAEKLFDELDVYLSLLDHYCSLAGLPFSPKDYKPYPLLSGAEISQQNIKLNYQDNFIITERCDSWYDYESNVPILYPHVDKDTLAVKDRLAVFIRSGLQCHANTSSWYWTQPSAHGTPGRCLTTQYLVLKVAGVWTLYSFKNDSLHNFIRIYEHKEMRDDGWFNNHRHVKDFSTTSPKADWKIGDEEDRRAESGYATFRAVVMQQGGVDNVYLLMRNRDLGLLLSRFNPATVTLEDLGQGPTWTNSVGYGALEVFKTMQVNVIKINGKDQLVVGILKGLNFEIHCYSPEDSKWTALTLLKFLEGSLEGNVIDLEAGIDRRLSTIGSVLDTVRLNTLTQVVEGLEQSKLILTYHTSKGQIETYICDPVANTWTRQASGPGFGSGIKERKYYGTYRTQSIRMGEASLERDVLLVMMRGSEGFQVKAYDPLSQTWQTLLNALVSDISLDEPKYYQPLQVISNPRDPHKFKLLYRKEERNASGSMEMRYHHVDMSFDSFWSLDLLTKEAFLRDFDAIMELKPECQLKSPVEVLINNILMTLPDHSPEIIDIRRAAIKDMGAGDDAVKFVTENSDDEAAKLRLKLARTRQVAMIEALINRKAILERLELLSERNPELVELLAEARKSVATLEEKLRMIDEMLESDYARFKQDDMSKPSVLKEGKLLPSAVKKLKALLSDLEKSEKLIWHDSIKGELPKEKCVINKTDDLMKQVRAAISHFSIYPDAMVDIDTWKKYATPYVAPSEGLIAQWQKATGMWDGSEADPELKEGLRRSLEEFMSSSAEEALRVNVAASGLAFFNVPGDGNCFFHSVLDQLQQRCPEKLEQLAGILNRPIDQKALRQLAVGGLICRSNFFHEIEINPDEFISKIAKDRVWANGPIIEIMAGLLGVKMVFVNSNREQPISTVVGGSNGTIYLAYQTEVHFQSLRGEPNDEFVARVLAAEGAPVEAIDLVDAAALGFVIDKNESRHYKPAITIGISAGSATRVGVGVAECKSP